MRARGLSALAVACASILALGAACSVEDLDLTAKQCPCVAGYTCDVALDRCVAVDPVTGAIPDGEPSLVTASDLQVVWATPNTIRWGWKLTGAAADFRAYEVVVGATADDVDKRVNVEIMTTNERPELGSFDARGGATRGPVEVWTLSDVRAPSVKQFVRIQVTDVKGHSSRTPIVGGTSAARPTSELVIFDGKVEKTAVPAAEMLFRKPAGGESHYFLEASCGAAKTCAKRGELVALDLKLAPAGKPFTSANFDAAFLELQLEGNVAVTSFDSLVAVAPGSATCPPANVACRFGLPGITQRVSGRTRLQVPLRELRNDAGKLTHAALQAKGFLVESLALSGTWKQGAVLRLFDARIRW